MRLLTLVAALALSTSAFAQTPAVKSPNANNPAATDLIESPSLQLCKRDSM